MFYVVAGIVRIGNEESDFRTSALQDKGSASEILLYFFNVPPVLCKGALGF